LPATRRNQNYDASKSGAGKPVIYIVFAGTCMVLPTDLSQSHATRSTKPAGDDYDLHSNVALLFSEPMGDMMEDVWAWFTPSKCALAQTASNCRLAPSALPERLQWPAEALMVDVIRYLAGNRHMILPDAWPKDWCP